LQQEKQQSSTLNIAKSLFGVTFSLLQSPLMLIYSKQVFLYELFLYKDSRESHKKCIEYK